MSTLLHGNMAQSFTGLGTWTHTVITAGQFTLSCEATSLPPGSGLTITLSQSGSQTVSHAVSVTGQTQPTVGNTFKFQCAAGDVLTCALTSSNFVDTQANAVKGTINLFTGYLE